MRKIEFEPLVLLFGVMALVAVGLIGLVVRDAIVMARTIPSDEQSVWELVSNQRVSGVSLLVWKHLPSGACFVQARSGYSGGLAEASAEVCAR